ncbi:1,2-dihydroxy-3-keto-5-methylthiopentene dioxygenase [Friedmanniomyces endolithicus]|nr:1,2-dihydroxy-3-keto-5-methylthiopentene dioxygenase [Friedmanniomyces endolithicus]KAK1813119.1 1,2-dihydroxy-3-keto-5-methylthiopentene dioxygenase [Friedmanniomyces endolithicus]
MATGSSPSSTLSPTLNSNNTTSHLHLPSSTDPPSDTNPPTQKVWLVFGATGHIGRSLVKCALSHGDNVAAVGRTRENTMPQMQGWHERCLGLLCDVRVRATVRSAMERCIDRFGRIDIIVNCTGYGVIGACEDQDTADLRSQFDTNFLGTLNIIQLSLPYFRHLSTSQPTSTTTATPANAGRYLIFSSTSGALGVPGLGPYCATKYATEGLIESMLYEVDTFGIKATLVEPGHMRLDEPTGLDDSAFTSHPAHPTGAAAGAAAGGAAAAAGQQNNMTKLARYGHFLVKKPSPPYDTPTAPAGHAGRVVQWLADRQPTSAVKSAELVWQLGHCRYPPLRLLLGSFAVESVRDRLRSVIEEIEDWKHLHFPSATSGEGEGEEGVKFEGEGDMMEGGEEEGIDGEGGAEVKEEDEG